MSIKLDMKRKSQTRLDFLYTEVTRKWQNQPRMLFRKQLMAVIEDK